MIQLSPSQEDYLHTVLQLVEANQVARVRDIARMRGVKPGSVSPAMRALSRLGLVVYERREFIALTESGMEVARRVARNKEVLAAFFARLLGIPKEKSTAQVCAIEHHLSVEAVEAIARLVELGGTAAAVPAGQAPPAEFTIADMVPGMEATVSLIRASGELSHQLIDMGLLPDATVRLVRMQADEFILAIGGFEVLLNAEQARAVVILL